MILAFDTYYYPSKAKTVCLTFENWTDKHYLQAYTEEITEIEEYVPGEFYRRELPCILSLLDKIPHTDQDVILIDGFVYLDDEQKPGLGAHLYHQLQTKIPVIGIAKTNFATIEKLKRPVYRGKSKNPLFITSIGLDIERAVTLVSGMHGEHRIPTLLKQLDQLTRV